jgi:hypothetical protein
MSHWKIYVHIAKNESEKEIVTVSLNLKVFFVSTAGGFGGGE